MNQNRRDGQENLPIRGEKIVEEQAGSGMLSCVTKFETRGKELMNNFIKNRNSVTVSNFSKLVSFAIAAACRSVVWNITYVNCPHMDDHLESLRTENKKLRGKHNELESNLTEEKEMVKYLHGVIKNYQQLLKKPETTRHLKSPSLKKVRRSRSDRRLASEEDVEEIFVKNLISEMGNVRGAERKEENNEKSVPNDNDKCVVLDTSDCENNDGINNNSRVSDEALSAIEHEKAELSPDKGKMFWDVKGQQSHCGSRRNTSIALEKICTERETVLKHYDKERILQEMTRTLDSMMAKATVLEKSLKQKDKHLKKMERRYEYLENIALGEESEWL